MRDFSWRFVAALVLSLGLFSVPGTAGAELVDTQDALWGVKTGMPSSTVGNWRALGWATEQVGGTMFVGGKFGETTNGSSTYSQPYIAAFDAGDGRFLNWWRPTTNGPVLALEASPDGSLFAGGEFTTWNGTWTGSLVKLDPDTGAPVPGWSTKVFGPDAVIRDIKLESDGWLYVVGRFSYFSTGGGSTNATNVLRLNPSTGAVDTNWLPTTDKAVWGVSTSKTRNEVYLAGWFTSVNGSASARGFAGVSSVNGTLLHGRQTVPYNQCVTCTSNYRMYDVEATEHGNVFVGGEQHALYILDETNNLNVELMHYTGCNRNQRPDCTRKGGEFQELERVGSRIYATCHCWADHMTSTSTIYDSERPTGTFTGTVSSVIAYNPQSGQRIQSFEPYMSGENGGFAITGSTDGCLWVAGDFSLVGPIGDQDPGRNLVRLCDQAGAGPDPSPTPLPPKPANCSVSLNGTTATVTWPAVQTAGDIEAYVIERKTGNGGWNWAGRVDKPGTRFTDDPVAGQQTTYRVKARYANRFESATTQCSPSVVVGGVPAPPASCTASTNGLAATISWPRSPNATQYQVSRSVDGSPQYFRLNTASLTASDTLRTSGTHSYQVKARTTGGAWSAATPCNPDLISGAVVDATPPASCTATANGTAATITWPNAADATEHQILRSVNGSQAWWRGVTGAASFNDTLRTSGSHTYSVRARNSTGVWSNPTPCSPTLTTGVPTPAAPPWCSAVDAGANANLSWGAVNGATEYQVLRSIDGSQDWWRWQGPPTSYSDQLGTGAQTYKVRARTGTGPWSATTTCSPTITR